MLDLLEKYPEPLSEKQKLSTITPEKFAKQIKEFSLIVDYLIIRTDMKVNPPAINH